LGERSAVPAGAKREVNLARVLAADAANQARLWRGSNAAQVDPSSFEVGRDPRVDDHDIVLEKLHVLSA